MHVDSTHLHDLWLVRRAATTLVSLEVRRRLRGAHGIDDLALTRVLILQLANESLHLLHLSSLRVLPKRHVRLVRLKSKAVRLRRTLRMAAYLGRRLCDAGVLIK